MTIAFAAAALAIAALFIARPFFVGAPQPLPVSPAITRRDVLLRRKDNVYSAIKDLEFEFHSGKLSPADYEELRGRYRAEALEVLQELDAAERALRARRQGAARPRCSACGHRNPSSSNFCEACGSAIGAGDDTCPSCGTTAEPQDHFCAVCGSALTADDHLTVELTS